MIYHSIYLVFSFFLFASCIEEAQLQPEPEPVIPEYKSWKKMEVNSSAYNSLNSQTKGNPAITAWGDTLKEGMKAIAVSRDLISQGLDHNTRVKIEGFEGYFLVKDKMNHRWKNKIDIYMGKDVTQARNWGTKELVIYVDTLNMKN